MTSDHIQHQEKNGLLLWKRCVNERNRFVDVRDLELDERKKRYNDVVDLSSKHRHLLLHNNSGHLHELHRAFAIFQGLR